MATSMPTNHLRIVHRDGKDVLQQKFTTFGPDEWRDVPQFASVEEADACGSRKPEPDKPNTTSTRTFGSMF